MADTVAGTLFSYAALFHSLAPHCLDMLPSLHSLLMVFFHHAIPVCMPATCMPALPSPIQPLVIVTSRAIPLSIATYLQEPRDTGRWAGQAAIAGCTVNGGRRLPPLDVVPLPPRSTLLVYLTSTCRYCIGSAAGGIASTDTRLRQMQNFQHRTKQNQSVSLTHFCPLRL